MLDYTYLVGRGASQQGQGRLDVNWRVGYWHRFVAFELRGGVGRPVVAPNVVDRLRDGSAPVQRILTYQAALELRLIGRNSTPVWPYLGFEGSLGLWKPTGTFVYGPTTTAAASKAFADGDNYFGGGGGAGLLFLLNPSNRDVGIFLDAGARVRILGGPAFREPTFGVQPTLSLFMALFAG